MKIVWQILLAISLIGSFSNFASAQSLAPSQSTIRDALVKINKAKNLHRDTVLTIEVGAGVVGASAVVFSVGLGWSVLHAAGYVPLILSEDSIIYVGGCAVLAGVGGVAIVGVGTVALGVEALIKTLTPTVVGGGTDTLDAYYLSSPEGLNTFLNQSLDEQEQFTMTSPKMQAAVIGLAQAVPAN